MSETKTVQLSERIGKQQPYREVGGLLQPLNKENLGPCRRKEKEVSHQNQNVHKTSNRSRKPFDPLNAAVQILTVLGPPVCEGLIHTPEYLPASESNIQVLESREDLSKNQVLNLNFYLLFNIFICHTSYILKTKTKQKIWVTARGSWS